MGPLEKFEGGPFFFEPPCIESSYCTSHKFDLKTVDYQILTYSEVTISNLALHISDYLMFASKDYGLKALDNKK